jgi:TonB family protein
MTQVSEQDTQRIETTSDDLHLHTERAETLTRLGILEHKAGRIAEAERLFTDAIEVGDRHLGANHPSLGVALNELSRLLVRHGDHPRAEPVLERLLALARAKGERHADVATALAGLAVAKRGMGDDEAAEQLFRQALEIREAVLPPNHMAIVITMEQLADTCTARGNLAEALALLQRALPRRECALGAEHPSVIAGREQKVELARRMFEARLAELRRTTVSIASAVVPIGAALMEPIRRVLTPVASPVVDVASEASLDALPEPTSHETTRPPRKRKRRRARLAAVSGTVVTVLMAIAGFALGTRNHTVSGTVPSVTSSEERLSLVSSAPNASSRAWARASGAHAGLPSTSTSTKTSEPRSAEERAPTLPSIRRLVMPKVALPNPDSVIQISPKVTRDADAELTGLGATLSAAPHTEEPGVMPPVLIGSAPQPRFPDELRARHVEGEVVVRFKVDATGRVDQSSMQVVHSANELFTAAVRSVLPRFRVQPARSTAPDAKPQAAWVQFSTQFTARN